MARVLNNLHFPVPPVQLLDLISPPSSCLLSLAVKLLERTAYVFPISLFPVALECTQQASPISRKLLLCTSPKTFPLPCCSVNGQGSIFILFSSPVVFYQVGHFLLLDSKTYTHSPGFPPPYWSSLSSLHCSFLLTPPHPVSAPRSGPGFCPLLYRHSSSTGLRTLWSVPPLPSLSFVLNARLPTCTGMS